MKKSELGNRMKNYENVTRNYLIRRLPVIIRLDGVCFHSFTRGMQKPFDSILMKTMWDTAKELCIKIQGCKIAYIQSDEISLLLTDYETLKTEAWFKNNIQKMTSVSASIATSAFNKYFEINLTDQAKFRLDLQKLSKKRNSALFDSRVFNLSKGEVCNYFIWRQKDATVNSIQMIGQSNFSSKRLKNKSCNQIQEMLFQEKGLNFNDFPIYKKRGVCIIKQQYQKGDTLRSKWVEDLKIPIFIQDRNYIEKYI